MSKELLKHIGENTAYSAKGHFKTSDLRRSLVYFYIVINMIFAVIAVSGLFGNTLVKILSVLSLLASILLLITETHGGLSICDRHVKCANKYLELHNDVYAEFLKDDHNQEAIMKLQDRMNAMNKSSRPNINLGGRLWAKWAIENFGEMKIWWK